MVIKLVYISVPFDLHVVQELDEYEQLILYGYFLSFWMVWKCFCEYLVEYWILNALGLDFVVLLNVLVELRRWCCFAGGESVCDRKCIWNRLTYAVAVTCWWKQCCLMYLVVCGFYRAWSVIVDSTRNCRKSRLRSERIAVVWSDTNGFLQRIPTVSDGKTEGIDWNSLEKSAGIRFRILCPYSIVFQSYSYWKSWVLNLCPPFLVIFRRDMMYFQRNPLRIRYTFRRSPASIWYFSKIFPAVDARRKYRIHYGDFLPVPNRPVGRNHRPGKLMFLQEFKKRQLQLMCKNVF